MNTLIVILLAVIALSEVSRLVLTHRGVSKKEHFRHKLEGTQKMIWDMEFKAFKTREIREDVRKEYDHRIQRIELLKQQIEKFPAEGDQAEKAKLQDQITLCERDRDRFLFQMQQLDAEVNGAKPTAENQDGVVGIVQQIESLRELVGMLKDWIKQV